MASDFVLARSTKQATKGTKSTRNEKAFATNLICLCFLCSLCAFCGLSSNRWAKPISGSIADGYSTSARKRQVLKDYRSKDCQISHAWVYFQCVGFVDKTILIVVFT